MMRVELKYHYTRLELESQYSSSNLTQKLTSSKNPNSNSTQKSIPELVLKLISNSNLNHAQTQTRTRTKPICWNLRVYFISYKLQKYSLKVYKTQWCTSSFDFKMTTLQSPITSFFIMIFHHFFRISRPMWDNFTV